MLNQDSLDLIIAFREIFIASVGLLLVPQNIKLEVEDLIGRTKLLDNKGVSLLMINSDKGEQLLKSLDSLCLTEVKKDEALQNSLKKPAAASSYRHQAMKMILSDEYEKAARRYGEYSVKGFIKEITRRVLKV